MLLERIMYIKEKTAYIPTEQFTISYPVNQNIWIQF